MPNYLQRESNKITIANFYEGFKLKKYNFEPSYQRRSVWTEEKQSFLLDSILKNYPIPPIFLHQKIDDSTGVTSYDVIDGKQRLTAIIEFIENRIPIADEENEDSEIAGLFFNDFNTDKLSKYKAHFWRYSIPIEYIDTGKKEIVDSIFDRLNRNGEPLTGQELRNANFYGSPLLNIVNEFSKHTFWTDRLEHLDRTRMEEIEFLSELIFLILEGHQLHANQDEIDRLYGKYATDIDINDIGKHFSAISKFMSELNLSYKERKISGVSHLYGIFAFSHVCTRHGIKAEHIAGSFNEFYDLWQDKDYSNEDVKNYKASMSSRTKDRRQRKKRTDALLHFCFGSEAAKMN